MECYCAACCAEPRYTYGREWMLICEARAVCRMEKVEARRKYLNDIRERRGKSAFDELCQVVDEQWKLNC